MKSGRDMACGQADIANQLLPLGMEMMLEESGTRLQCTPLPLSWGAEEGVTGRSDTPE